MVATSMASVIALPYGSARATPYAAVSTYAAVSASLRPTPSSTASSPEPDRAGSRAGEGRQRPGRVDDGGEDAETEDSEAEGTGDEDTAGEDPDEVSGDAEAGDGDQVDDTDASASPAVAPVASDGPQDAVRQAATQGERADGPVLQILPLGSGLVLIGLGIALALAALRLRRS
ncbi:hypothetical protein ABZ725_10445 [Streptomyces sp. NPDC006872]|uniref:hypothetical protein n=1 Tax=Streptomyces sp. NPDC006872 TaxID=3155720 RepID=UPI0033DE0A33